MRQDACGLPVSPGPAEALVAYDRGVHELLGWGRDALAHFEAAAALDPGFALAHAGAAVCHFLDERFPEARAAIETARAAAGGQTARERGHVEALGLWIAGRAGDAERAMREHLATYPRDLPIAQRLYFVWFWTGRFPEMLDLTGRLVAQGVDGFLLGLHAFALEEADRFDEALGAAERALARNAQDAWAVHALAHVLYEEARFDSGLDRVPAAMDPCTHLGWFRNHLLWHLALMHLGRGDLARAGELARAAFERAPSAIAGDLHDSISLLWRLDLAGERVGDRWAPFASIAADRLGRTGLPFHVVHVAMALAGARDWATGERQLAGLTERVPRDRTGLLRDLVIPLIVGMRAFAAGDYRAAVAAIEPLQPRIVGLGGSRAQRDVFHDTLLEACFRAGDAERAARLVAERVARRPEEPWLTRQRGLARG